MNWNGYYKNLVNIGALVEALRPAHVAPLYSSPYYDMELKRVAEHLDYVQGPRPSWNLE